MTTSPGHVEARSPRSATRAPIGRRRRSCREHSPPPACREAPDDDRLPIFPPPRRRAPGSRRPAGSPAVSIRAAAWSTPGSGDRSVTVRGLSERIVKADLAVLPLEVRRRRRRPAGGPGRYRRPTPPRCAASSPARVTPLRDRPRPARSHRPVRSRVPAAERRRPLPRRPDADRAHHRRRPGAGHHPPALDQLIRQGVVLQDYTGPSDVLHPSLNEVRPRDDRRGHQALPRSWCSSPATPARSWAASRGDPGLVPDPGPRRCGYDPVAQVFKKLRVVTTVSYRSALTMQMRFLCDEMLLRLARPPRAAGYSTQLAQGQRRPNRWRWPAPRTGCW